MDPSCPNSQFTLTEATATLTDVCTAESIPADDAQLMRLGENVIFLLPHDNLVIRIGRDENVVADARKEVAVACTVAFPAACGSPTWPRLARSVSYLRRSHTSEVGGEADMPRQLNRRICRVARRNFTFGRSQNRA